MKLRSKTLFGSILTVLLVVSVVGCGSTPAPEPDSATATPAPQAPQATEPAPTTTPTPQPSDTPPPPPPSPTPTPTPTPVVVAPGPTTPAPPDSRCAGLAGSIEVQILVGPAEVAGLEPVAVGSVPFAVTSDQPPFTVQGSAPIAYADVLVQEWGTYAVTMDVQATVSGECSGEPGGEALNLTVEIPANSCWRSTPAASRANTRGAAAPLCRPPSRSRTARRPRARAGYWSCTCQRHSTGSRAARKAQDTASPEPGDEAQQPPGRGRSSPARAIVKAPDAVRATHTRKRLRNKQARLRARLRSRLGLLPHEFATAACAMQGLPHLSPAAKRRLLRHAQDASASTLGPSPVLDAGQ